MEWQRDLKDPNEFLETVKIDLFEDEVYVFTPKGDVKALTKGSTPIDFAYAVHSKVGDRCSGARVNGLMVPLRYQLRNGDTVEIITSPTQKPSKDWLTLVATSRAKAKIRAEIRAEQRERSGKLGRELMERELRRVGYAWSRAEKLGILDKAVETCKVQTLEELLIFVGYGKFTAAEVVEGAVPQDERKAALDEPAKDPIRKLLRKVMGRPSPTGIQVQGEDDVLVRFAKCCNPVPGDPIVGFITRGRGVAVHLRECDKAIDLDPDRRIDVTWAGKAKAPRPVQIRVQSGDKPGLLAEMSRAFATVGVNIAQANCRTVDGKAVNTFHFGVEDLDQLKGVIRALQKIDGVYAVERVAAEQS
jgi:GTP pyrophosphokinase